MLRRSTIRTRVLLVPVVPAAALLAVVALNLHRSGWLVAGAVVAATAGLVLAFVVGRTITKPLRDLAAIAADFDGYRSTEGTMNGRPDDVLPPRRLAAGPEIAELAISIAKGRERVAEFASEQRSSRRSVTDLVAHISLRNERLLGAALDALGEISRRDHEPVTAAAIARVHRIVARVDRATASALVLIGEGGRVAPSPASITDIVWAASLAIDSSDRVDPIELPHATVHADAVVDVSHLIAELLDNAVDASPPPGRVTLLGQADGDGGYVLSVVDAGTGLTPDLIDAANRRVRRSARLDQVPPREIGLDVVGRLARRHGVAVRLGQSAGGGIVVRVELPAKLFAAPVPVAVAVPMAVSEPSSAPLVVEEPVVAPALVGSATVATPRDFDLAAAERIALRTQSEDILPKRDNRKWAAALARARS